MSIEEIPENNLGENRSRRTDGGGCSPWLVSLLLVGSLIGVRACNQAHRIRERELESEMRQAERNFYQDMGKGYSDSFSPPVESKDENLKRIYQEIDRLERKEGLGDYREL